MKNQFIFLLLLINLVACKAFQPATTNTGNTEQRGSVKPHAAFISGISTSESGSSNSPVPAVYNGVAGTNTGSMDPRTQQQVSTNTALSQSGNSEYSPLQFKFAILTNSPVEELTNLRLLVFMDQWYGAPYHYGGSNRDGIDCSAFASLLISSVYDVNQLPRVSSDQYHASKRVSKKDLREGDLVFFHTLGKGHRVTHVGVYLYNNRFVHASIAGVQISDLGEGYYMHHYVGGGRVVENDRAN